MAVWPQNVSLHWPGLTARLSSSLMIIVVSYQSIFITCKIPTNREEKESEKQKNNGTKHCPAGKSLLV